MTEKMLIEREVGSKYKSENTKVVSEQEVDIFVDTFGPRHPAFQNDQAAQKVGFEKRVVPGPAHLPIVLELLRPVLSAMSILVGTDNNRFINPLYPGRPIRAEAELVSKKDLSSGAIVGTYKWSLKYQDGTIISYGHNT